MTQTNLFMDDDNLRLYVDVQPLYIDELENSKNAAAASAALAAQSAESARTWKEGIEEYKTNLEIFYAQASNGLTTLCDDSLSDILSSKNDAVSDVISQKNSIISSINTAGQSAVNNITTNGQNYVNQARDYAEQAKNTVDNRVSLEHLNQSKALLTGEETTDEDVVKDVMRYAHSTFDASKFTKVGNPIVTSDGIASGFSSSKYLTIPDLHLETANSWEIDVEWLAGTSSAGNNGILSPATGDNILIAEGSHIGGAVIGLSSNGASWDIANLRAFSVSASTNDRIKVHTEFTGTQYKFQVFNLTTGDNGTLYLIDSTNKVYSSPTVIGNLRGTGYACRQSVDLKNIKVRANGVPIFSGCKTGIDVIKPVNFVVQTHLYAYVYETHTIYADSSSEPAKLFNADGTLYTGSDWTVSGNIVSYNGNTATYTSASDITEVTNPPLPFAALPNISEDGIMTEFGVDGKRIKALQAKDFTGKSWKQSIRFYFDTRQTADTVLIGLSGSYTSQGNIKIGSTHSIVLTGLFGNTGDQTSDGTKAILSSPLTVNGWYKAVIEFNYAAGTYTLSVYYDNGTLFESNTYTPPTTEKQLKTIANSGNGYQTIGTVTSSTAYKAIDVNSYKVWIDEALVYQPMLIIPYTESAPKFGSKIVDTVYHSRVDDAFEQGFIQRYYVIDEKNQKAWLPKGEIYGMIENLRKLIIQLTTQ